MSLMEESLTVSRGLFYGFPDFSREQGVHFSGTERHVVTVNQGIASRVMNYFREKSTENMNKTQQIGKLAAYKTLISWM